MTDIVHPPSVAAILGKSERLPQAVHALGMARGRVAGVDWGMNATETLARQMARSYACKLAAYCMSTKILPPPASPEDWTKRLNQYVEDYWWDYLPEAEKINKQAVG